jgi:hypothetical protein
MSSADCITVLNRPSLIFSVHLFVCLSNFVCDFGFHCLLICFFRPARVMYDRSVLFMAFVWSVLHAICAPGGAHRFMTAQYWSAHQRFFRQMLMASKVPKCAKLALEAVAQGARRQFIAETNRMYLVLFGMRNSTFCPCLAAIHRIHISVIIA